VKRALLVFAACGGTSPPAPLAGSATDHTPPAVTTGTCEPDATQALDSVRLTDGSSNPWRFIDHDKRPLATPFLYDNGPDYFQEGFARIVDASGKFGFIAASGSIVVPPRYDFVYPYCHGIAKTALDGKAGYLDTNGQPTKGPPDDDRPLILPMSDG
jgi:WG containing repeat